MTSPAAHLWAQAQSVQRPESPPDPVAVVRGLATTTSESFLSASEKSFRDRRVLLL